MRTRIRLGAVCLAVIVWGLMHAGELHAQRWQSIFGGPFCREGSFRGTQPISTGGYITAGFTESTAPGCAATDVYVVKTDNNGTLVWSFTYDVGGGNDNASCIRECANGDFIIAGNTANASACCCNPNNIFLLRINSAGGVVWVKSYGSTRDELCYSVIETTLGDGGANNPGDFIVSGSSVNAAGNRDAYLLRTTAGGKVIWDRTYAGPAGPISSDDDFMDVLESVFQTGTLYACGRTGANLIPIGATGRAMLARVSAFTGAQIGQAVTWGPAGQYSDATAVEELRVGAQATQIVVTGQTPGPVTTNTYIIRFAPAIACPPVFAASYYIQNSATRGNDIIELRNGANIGDLVVVGDGTVAGGIGASDVLTIEVNATTLNYAGSNLNLFGGVGGDQGYGLAEVVAAGARTAGFIVSGNATPNISPVGDPMQLYLIKTDATGNSLCNNKVVADVANLLAPVFTCTPLNQATIGLWCTPPYTADPHTWGTNLCFVNPENRRDENPNEGTSLVPGDDRSNDGVIAITDDATVASYPNPVRRGSTLKLEYTLARSGRITIDVVDVSGKTVYTHSGEYASGTNQIPVNTDGWPDGAYIIKLTTAGSAATQRVTVLDR